MWTVELTEPWYTKAGSKKRAFVGKSQLFQNAWGDIKSLPLAKVQIVVGGKKYTLEVAVTKGLAYNALLGRDIPELNQLAEKFDKQRAEEALMVTSRAQARREQLEDKELQRKQLQSEVQPHILEDEDSSEVSHTQEETCQSIQPVHEHFMDINEESTLTSKSPQESKSNLGDLYNFDPSLFLQVRDKKKLTRSQKRQQSVQLLSGKEASLPEKMSREELELAQKSDPTLAEARCQADVGGKSYLWHDGLLYRVREVKTQEEPELQIVLPSKCRESVLELAHSAPLAGHFGKRKTTECILKRFFWPGVQKEVQALCRSCPKCQKTAVVQKN